MDKFKNKKFNFKLSDGRKLYSVIEQLKHKYDYTPFIKDNLINLFKDAKRLGIQRAVFIAKKHPRSYEKSLLVYKTRPFCIKDINNPNPYKKFMVSTIYLLLPDEEPPKDVDIKPNSACSQNEEKLDLKNEKETGEKVSIILNNLLNKRYPFQDIPVPEAPPSEDYFYLLPKPKKGKLALVRPVKFLDNFPAERSYNSNNWHMTVGGTAVAEPITPHDPCYYDILCCNKPPKDSLYKRQNLIKTRKFSAFNFTEAGVLLPLAYFTVSKIPSSPTNPPVIPPPSYPKRKYKVPKYKVPLPTRPSAPTTSPPTNITTIKPKPLQTGGANKPATSGVRKFKSSGSPSLSGKQKPNSGSFTQTGVPATLRSYNINSGIKRHQRKIATGGSRRNAQTQAYKRNAWYNSKGVLTRGSFLRVKDSEPEPRIDPEDNLGLIPSEDIPEIIQINGATNRIGIGYSTELVEIFKDDPPLTLGTGYYFTQSTFSQAQDPDFGNVATDTYQDNLFHFPFDLPFSTPEDAYYDFFVKIKGYAKDHVGGVVPAVYWSTKTQLPVSIEGACSAVVNNKIYVFGGWDGIAYQNTVWEYDPALDNWTAKANMPTARRDACCGAVGNKIYVFGGFNGAISNATEEYDVGLNAWTPKAVMSAPSTSACCGVVGGKCYVIGGNVGVVSVDNEEYDPGTNTWANKALLPTARENLCCGVDSGNIYVIGGFNGIVQVPTNEEYNVGLNAWTPKNPMNIPLEGSVADANGGKIYVFGGNDGAIAFPFTESYDPIGDAWTPEPSPIPVPRYDLCGNFVNNKFYAISGNAGANLTDLNNEYDPNAVPTIEDMDTQVVFDLFGRKDGQDVFEDTYLIANSQSVSVVDNADVVVFELKFGYSPTSTTHGDLTVTLKAFKADNSVTYGTISHTFNNITDIVDGKSIHARVRVQQSDLGQAGGQVILNPFIELPSQSQDLGNLNVNVNSDIDRIDKLSYGYVDYRYSANDPKPLTSKGSDYSASGIVTGLVITNRPINRNYVWDYTRN